MFNACECRLLTQVHTFEFLPAMPPSTVSGNVMRAQMTRMMQMVPNGNAAVDCTGHRAQGISAVVLLS